MPRRLTPIVPSWSISRTIMERFTPAISLYSLAMEVKQWLDDTRQKEVSLTALTHTMSQVCHVLEPFKTGTSTNFEPTVVAGCMSIRAVLTRIQQRILGLKDKSKRRAIMHLVDFFKFLPGDVIKSLREEEHNLSQELTMFLITLSIVGYFRDRERGGADERLSALVLSISNGELLDFWRKYIGGKTLWAPCDALVAALKQHLDDTAAVTLSNATYRTIMYQLDEYAFGGVSLSNLSQHVGQQTLAQFCQRFNNVEQPDTNDDADTDDDVDTLKDSSASLFLAPASEETPTLIWIDDNLNHDESFLSVARVRHVQVIGFTSTASATAWIDANEMLLHQMDSHGKLRFITDNVRLENGPKSPFINLKTGEYILRYLRGRLFKAPVLVFCDASILSTEFVKSYNAAGSTVDDLVVKKYVSSLARQCPDDVDWRAFDAFL